MVVGIIGAGLYPTVIVPLQIAYGGRERPVRVGDERGGRVPVRAGVRDGERVVVRGALTLRGELERAQMQEAD